MKFCYVNLTTKKRGKQQRKGTCCIPKRNIRMTSYFLWKQYKQEDNCPIFLKYRKKKTQKPDNTEISTQQKCFYKKAKIKMFSEIQRQKQIITNTENRKKILKEALSHRSIITVGNLNPHRVKSIKDNNYKYQYMF